MRSKPRKSHITMEELINSYSLPLPMYFQGAGRHNLLVHPYNYFESTYNLNYYAHGQGVLIFKSYDHYYITLHTESFESALKIYGYHELRNFPGFNPRELKPVDPDARKLWNDLLAKFRKK